VPDFELIEQVGPDLGSRLDYVTRVYLGKGYQQVILMDSDSPTLPGGNLDEAFKALQSGSDVVLGPCDDGGYYLIGMKQPVPRLLHEVRMSTETVTADTLALADAQDLQVSLLTYWYDVDVVVNLKRLRSEMKESTEIAARHTRRLLEGTRT
jgi:glycosyltransferase A (GT-A) superfamily protein (DUF2064 family)